MSPKAKTPFYGAFFFHLLLLPVLSALPILPEPDQAPVQAFLPTPTPPATIPAFPEQSDVASCPLNLPEELFHSVSTACGGKGLPRMSRCCPVLAVWLYSAYSDTALGRAGRMRTEPYDLPILPDDSETCVDNLEKALKEKEIELFWPNETCDLVYCYCGIRLHPLSYPEAFLVSNEGKLDGDASVNRLERDCLIDNGKRHVSLGACSKSRCLV